ncbi:MAG: LytR family transcriptional regulator [Selenomonas ruminantium]|nr:LytR family transcriptional regulator [Selenomonas ruminantium]
MRKKRKVKRDYTRVKWLGGICLLILLVGMAFMKGNPTGDSALDVVSHPDEVKYVMIMGVDRRADDAGRSDTLMVAAVDVDSSKAALLSIPRDTRVAIEGNGYDKINHAYAFGGHKLTQRTVENLLGVKIDHYILIDTKSFARIIDAIGGVDLNVEKRMYYEDPWDDNGGLVIDLYPGEQHLDGDRAIQYVRYRDGEGDIGRVGRQQKFVKAVLAQVISPDMLPRLPKLAEEVRKAVETDMSVTELLEFAGLMESVHKNGLAAQMVPGQPAFLQDISYWIPDITDVREILPKALGLEMSKELQDRNQQAEDKYLGSLPEGIKLGEKHDGQSGKEEKAEEESQEPMKPSEIKVLVINDSGINGAGAEAAEILQRKGFVISSVETGKTSSREQTSITTSARNTDVFYGMPFPCIIMDGGSSNQAVLRIGLDYKTR